MWDSASIIDFLDLSSSIPPPRDYTRCSIDRARNIPVERFAQVARLWPTKPRPTRRFVDDLWHKVVAFQGDNIFMGNSISGTSPAPTVDDDHESKWGMDDARREELIQEFLMSPTRFQLHEGGKVNDNSVDDSKSMPSTRLLNLGLDMAFRRDHTLLPFIHQPTFSAKLAHDSVLFSLCLLGLALLNSERSRRFTLSYLPVSIGESAGHQC